MYERVCNYGHQVKQREQESDAGLGRAQPDGSCSFAAMNWLLEVLAVGVTRRLFTAPEGRARSPARGGPQEPFRHSALRTRSVCSSNYQH